MADKFVLNFGKSRAVVDSFGAMTVGDFFIDGKTINPFFESKWTEADTSDSFLQHLKGDFFCLPFGKFLFNGIKKWSHGYSSNGLWQKLKGDADSIELGLDYDEHDIERVNRKIVLGENYLDFTDTVFAKKTTSLPVGIHPMFRLTDERCKTVLTLPKCKSIRTYPRMTDESSIFLVNQQNVSVKNVPLKDGGSIDATLLPLNKNTEELLFLTDVSEGKILLENLVEGYCVSLEWDINAYTNCLLWISNFGRKFMPWNGKNLCLGIEPVTAPFDLGNTDSLTDTALNECGIKTKVAFNPDKPTSFWHRITVTKI